MIGSIGKPAIAAALAAMVLAPAIAQSLLYVPPARAAPVEQPPSPNCNARIPLEAYVGKKIVFLPKERLRRDSNYPNYVNADKKQTSPAYADLVGRIGTIVLLVPGGPASDSRGIVIRMDDGRTLITHAMAGVLTDVLFLDDLRFAKDRYVGKMLWIKTRRVRIDQETGLNEGIVVDKYSAVKVLDVVPGTDGYNPLDFVIEATGHGAVLLPARVSQTNQLSPSALGLDPNRMIRCDFDAVLETEDPRLKRHWPDSVWADIAQERVHIGMSLEQVVMAKGNPEEIREDRTAGSYDVMMVYRDHTTLFLDHDLIVTEIRN